MSWLNRKHAPALGGSSQRALGLMNVGVLLIITGITCGERSALAPAQPAKRHPVQSSVRPRPTAKSGIVAFVQSDSALNSYIFRMSADGSDIRQLTNRTGYTLDQQPTVSPSGARIAFFRVLGVCRRRCKHEGLWVMRSNGRHKHKIASGELVHPSWSPAGSAIAVVKVGRGDSTTIETMSPDGTHIACLPSHGLHQLELPSWLPSGRRLIFSAMASDGAENLYTERVDGSHLTRVTNGSGLKTAPSMSPSGHQIVFMQARSPQSPWHLMIVSADGRRPRRITRGDVPDEYPHFDATGHWILYQHGVRGARAYVIHPNGTNNEPLNRRVDATSPTWKS